MIVIIRSKETENTRIWAEQ